MTIIRVFNDGTVLAFGHGFFDDWCVLLTNARVRNYAPRDREYFLRLSQLAAIYEPHRLYQDFVRIYDVTDADLAPSTLALIVQLASGYSGRQSQVELIFTLLYATMVAEENKHKAILKKRIKRLAVHQLLLEQVPVIGVTTFSKGKRWHELDAECRQRGF